MKYRRCKNFRFVFSLRGLLILMALVGLLVYPVSRELGFLRRQQDLADRVMALGGEAYFNYQKYGVSNQRRWIQKNLYGGRLLGLHVIGPLDTSEFLPILMEAGELGTLEDLWLGGIALDSQSIAMISKLHGLEELTIKGHPKQFPELTPLGKLHHLRMVNLSTAKNLQPYELHFLEMLPELTTVELSYNKLSKYHIRVLSQLAKLNELHIICSEVTEEDLAPLKQTTSLNKLVVSPDLNEEHLNRLLPNVEIIGAL